LRNSERFAKSRRALSELFTDDQPLGPIQTPADIDLAEFDAIFDSDNQIWKSVSSQPSVVIGRKGAGKTAFLKGLTLKNSKDVVVFLRSNNVFRVSLTIIQQFAWQRRLVFVEDIADVWKRMFWILIGLEVLRTTSRRYSIYRDGPIKSYLEQFNIDPDDEYEEVFRKILDTVHKNLANDVNLTVAFDGPASSIGFSGPKKVSFKVFREFVERIFERSTGRNALILIDNMEEIDFTIDNLPDAVAALLKAVSEFRKAKHNYGCSFCVPAEMFHKMLEISSNPSKDFEHNILLQWRAGDLIKIATLRLAKYLFLFEHKFFMDRLDPLDFTDRRDIQKCWGIIFPGQITNGVGTREPAATYVMRHTQLLPRNILQILTEILKMNRDMGMQRYEVSERALIEGLRRAEVRLSQETFVGYKHIYPSLAEVCEKTINRLPVKFKYGELQRAFNESGKAASGYEEFTEFRRMLLETGIVGKIIDRTEKYIVALFEYTLPNRLNVTDRDELCVHPIFSGIFRAQRPEGTLPIYPYGSDPDDKDFRLSISV
jgi:KaiC/GvpD/RAD55 family RecA-like ATPase